MSLIRKQPVAVVSGIVAGVLLLLLLQLAWKWAGEFDANPQQATLKNQLMQEKSDAMDDVLHAVVRGRLEEVSEAAVRMKSSANTINGYLATDVYEKYGEDFYRAIADIRVAANAKDRESAKEAILRLERSCIECHYLITPPE